MARADGDGEVGGEGPGSGRPDDNGGIGGEIFAFGDVERDVDGGGFFVLVFDLGFGEGGLRAEGPEDGAFAAVDEVFFDEGGEGAEDVGFVGGVEGEVGMVPVAEDAEAAELGALEVDVFAGVGFGALADFDRSEVGLFFDHFEFDGESVAVPPGNKGRAEAGHGLGFDDEVFEDFVERGAHVDVAVGEGGAVVEDEERGVFAGFLDAGVEVVFFPRGELLRFAGGEAGFHWKIRAGEIESVFVVRAHESGRD